MRVLNIVCAAAMIGAMSLSLRVATASPIAHRTASDTVATAPGTLVADVELDYPTDSSHVRIPVSVAGQPPRWFIVDIGAGRGILYPAVRAALDTAIRPNGYIRVNGYGGSSIADLVLLDSLRIGNVTRNSIKMIVMDIEGELHIKPFAVRPSSGVIGRDMLDAYDIEFDFPAKRFRLYTQFTDTTHPPAYLSGLSCIPYYVDSNYMVLLKVDVNGRQFFAFFDTGAPATTLTTEAASRVGITSKSPGVQPVKKWSGGVGGEIKEFAVPNLHMSAGAIKFHDRVLLFGDEQMSTSTALRGDEQPQVILGLNSVSDRKVVISTSTNQMCFGPARH